MNINCLKGNIIAQQWDLRVKQEIKSGSNRMKRSEKRMLRVVLGEKKIMDKYVMRTN